MGMMVFLFSWDFDTQACPINLWSHYLLGLGLVGWTGFSDCIGLIFSFFFCFHLRDGDVWGERALMIGGLDIYNELGVWHGGNEEGGKLMKKAYEMNGGSINEGDGMGRTRIYHEQEEWGTGCDPQRVLFLWP